MKKRRLKRVIIFFLAVGTIFAVFCDFAFGMNPNPNSTLLYETSSPKGTYTIRAYVSIAALSSDSVWCEYDANNVLGWSRVFYKEYRMDYVDIKWADDNTVIINGRTLNLPFDIYDSSRDKNFVPSY